MRVRIGNKIKLTPCVMTDENLDSAKDPQHSANMSADSTANPLTQRYAPELLGKQASYAPIGFSIPTDPNIQLVDITQLQRLEELHDDSAFMQTVWLAIIGLTVGILIADVMHRQGSSGQVGTLVFVLVGCVIIFGFLTRRTKKRTEKLRRRVLYDSIK
jgi:uncharacterized membrane protein YeaQ/YmgE (transglycosylase-associated protein family)